MHSGTASEIGPDAFALLVAVVMTEDEIHYQRPPNFYNEQLANRCGISTNSKHALIRARQIAIDAGLLWYEPGAKRRPGRYFVIGFSADSTPKVNRMCTESEPNVNPSIPIPLPIPKEKRPRFEKPSLNDVKAYCQERRNRVNPEQFIDHYEANGWVQGKGKPIRDWKAAVRTWERNGFDNSTPKKSEEYPDLTQRKRSC
jgi:hypothetical protein